MLEENNIGDEDWMKIKQGEYKRLKKYDSSNFHSYTARIGHRFFKRKEECKEHKWRIGSGKGVLINGKLVVIGRFIWCEGCNKKILANYFSDWDLYNKKKKRRRNRR